MLLKPIYLNLALQTTYLSNDAHLLCIYIQEDYCTRDADAAKQFRAFCTHSSTCSPQPALYRHWGGIEKIGAGPRVFSI